MLKGLKVVAMINDIKEVVVIDGQGGGVGKSIIEAIKSHFPDTFIIGVGTNSIATNNLKKGGADAIATGENAIVYNASQAKMIIGTIGICFANSMYGEISPRMAQAINESEAIKYLIPISKSNAQVVGVVKKTIPEYMNDLITILK
jgi:ABC-type amino acid transport substrate-binding protein